MHERLRRDEVLDLVRISKEVVSERRDVVFVGTPDAGCEEGAVVGADLDVVACEFAFAAAAAGRCREDGLVRALV